MQKISRLRTYVEGLDERLNGGIPEKSIVLIGGTHGTMKTTFCFNILYHLAKDHKLKSLYLSLEQRRGSLVRQMEGFGMDMGTVEDRLLLADVGVLRKIMKRSEKSELEVKWSNEILGYIRTVKEGEGIDIAVLDSLNALGHMSAKPFTRNDIYYFFDELRDMGLTVLMISEMDMGTYKFGEFMGEPFLCDGIIHLDFERDKRALNLMIGVIKMRESDIKRVYYPLVYGKKGFKILTE